MNPNTVWVPDIEEKERGEERLRCFVWKANWLQKEQLVSEFKTSTTVFILTEWKGDGFLFCFFFMPRALTLAEAGRWETSTLPLGPNTRDTLFCDEALTFFIFFLYSVIVLLSASSSPCPTSEKRDRRYTWGRRQESALGCKKKRRNLSAASYEE